MAGPNYKAVRLVIADADPDVSGPISSGLFQRGMHDVIVCRDGEALAETVNSKLVDVLLFDVELPNTDFVETIHKLRHKQIGQNPFVLVIAMASMGAQDQIQRVIAAGVDDLLRKPVPATRVISRIENLLRPRRPFTIAESYIGPNRRKILRQQDAEYSLQVPNTLRSKVQDSALKSEVNILVDQAWDEIAKIIASQPPKAITQLADRVLAFYEGKGTDEELRRDLAHLVDKAEELVRRHKNTKTAHVAEIASSMAGVIRRIAESPFSPQKRDIKLFPEITDATRIAAYKTDASIEAVIAIADLVHDALGLPRLTMAAPAGAISGISPNLSSGALPLLLRSVRK